VSVRVRGLAEQKVGAAEQKGADGGPAIRLSSKLAGCGGRPAEKCSSMLAALRWTAGLQKNAAASWQR